MRLKTKILLHEVISKELLSNSENISPRAYIFQRPFFNFEGLTYRRKLAFQNCLGLYWEGNMHLKIHWASLAPSYY